MSSENPPPSPSIGEILAETTESRQPSGLPVTKHEPSDLEAISRELARRQRIESALYRWSNVCPPDLQSTNWKDPRLEKHLPAISGVLAYQLSPKGLIASGPSGVGKSRAMWELMRRFAEQGRDVQLYHAQDWFSCLQEQIHYGRDDARGWVEAVAKREIVYLDDLGQQALQASRSEWAQSWFFRFLDLRLGHKLPLFITTNLHATQMAGGQRNIRSDPLLRRLLELCDPIRFD